MENTQTDNLKNRGAIGSVPTYTVYVDIKDSCKKGHIWEIVVNEKPLQLFSQKLSMTLTDENVVTVITELLTSKQFDSINIQCP